MTTPITAPNATSARGDLTRTIGSPASPITFVAAVAGTGNTTTTFNITAPTTVAGDVLIVTATNGGANADNTMGGTIVSTGGVTWAKVISLNGGGTTTLSGVMWWARATGNHAGQTITIAGATDSSAGNCIVLRGCRATGVPYDATTSALLASGTNTLGALSAAGTAGAWLVLGLATDDDITSTGTTATDPAAVTTRAEHLSLGGVDTANMVAAAEMTGTGSTGTISWTNARGAGIYQVALGAVFVAGPTPPVTTGLIGWWDASFASSITAAGGLVSQWNDLSGTGNNAVQGTGSAQPGSGSRTQNAKNVLNFDGGDRLDKTGMTVTQPFTVVFVAAFDGTGGTQNLLGYGPNCTYGIRSAQWAVFAGSILAGGTADTAWHCHIAVVNGASSAVYVDSPTTTTATGNAGGDPISNLYLGSSSGSEFMDGGIGEAFIHNVALGSTDRTTLYNALKAKWSTP